jgi:hypothetical protein
MDANGKPVRRGTFIDVPTEIPLPPFVGDDNLEDGALAFGRFTLSLQSVVCHRGNTVDSGHYISLVRAPKDASDVKNVADSNEKWLLFDDLAKERVRAVDVTQALKDECPYLLFYQVRPIDEDSENTGGEKPPSYDSMCSGSDLADLSVPINPGAQASLGSVGLVDGASSVELSIEEAPPEDPRGRASTESNRRRITFGNGDAADIHASAAGSSNVVARPSSSVPPRSTSRRGSKNEQKRFSTSLTRLTTKLTKDRPGITIERLDPDAPRLPKTIQHPVVRSTDQLDVTAPSDGKLKKRPKSKSRISRQNLADGKYKGSKEEVRECLVM